MKKSKLSFINILSIVSTIVTIINGIFSIANHTNETQTTSLVLTLFIVFAFISIVTLSAGLIQERRKNNINLNKIERIKNDLFDGRANSDILINSVFDEDKRQPIILNAEDINIDVIHNESKTDYDIKYNWILRGISKKNPLDLITLNIGGDSPISHSELELETKIKIGSQWRNIEHEIQGTSRFKRISLKLGQYSVRKNLPFEICCSYIWKKSFLQNSDNTFSFGKNLYCEDNTPDIKIYITANKECIEYARLHIRETNLETNNVTDRFMDLSIHKLDENKVYIDIQAPNSTGNNSYSYYIEIPKSEA